MCVTDGNEKVCGRLRGQAREVERMWGVEIIRDFISFNAFLSNPYACNLAIKRS